MTNVFGYTNASWTLRADLISEYMCRVLNLLERDAYVEARPVPDGVEPGADFVDFSSGYFQRALHKFPKQGTRAPWIITQNYARDIFLMRHGKIEDGALVLRRAHETLDQLVALNRPTSQGAPGPQNVAAAQ